PALDGRRDSTKRRGDQDGIHALCNMFLRRRFRSLVLPRLDSELKSMLRNTPSSFERLLSSIFSRAMLIFSPMFAGSEGHQGTSREGSKRRGVTRKCCKGPERGLCFVGQTPCISRITISCACIRPCAYQRAVFGIQNSELLVKCAWNHDWRLRVVSY